MLKDLKLAFFTAAVTSAGLSQPGAFGYRAVVSDCCFTFVCFGSSNLALASPDRA